MNKSSNTFWHSSSITRKDRQKLNGHSGAILWFTGLSGSGKSTLAHAVEERLYKMDCRTTVLDGDNVRHGLCGDLSFSEDDRTENIRRIGQVACLFVEAGTIVLTAFISPFRIDRQRVRMMVDKADDFIEIYCNCPLEICEQRDVKGLYQRARKGEIADFTGISSPYESPVNADLIVDTGSNTVDYCVDQVIHFLEEQGLIEKT
jgi:adenylylsulfate kinase